MTRNSGSAANLTSPLNPHRPLEGRSKNYPLEFFGWGGCLTLFERPSSGDAARSIRVAVALPLSRNRLHIDNEILRRWS